jgi:hypothetical protein
MIRLCDKGSRDVQPTQVQNLDFENYDTQHHNRTQTEGEFYMLSHQTPGKESVWSEHKYLALHSQKAKWKGLVQGKHMRVQCHKWGEREHNIVRYHSKKHKMGLTSYGCWSKLTEWLSRSKSPHIFNPSIRWRYVCSFMLHVASR